MFTAKIALAAALTLGANSALASMSALPESTYSGKGWWKDSTGQRAYR